MDDLRAVMDAAGSERAAVYGGSEGGPLAILFAATYPERVSALVLYGAYARLAWAPDYPDGVPDDAWIDGLPLVEASWGRGTGEGPFVNALAPNLANDPVFQKTYGRWERLSASPGAVVAILQMIHDIDVRHLLTAIQVPTLVVHRTADPSHAAGSRYLGCAHQRCQSRRTTRRSILPVPRRPGRDPRRDRGVPHRRSSRTRAGSRARDRAVHRHRVVDERAAALGDAEWTRLLDQHDSLAAREVDRHRGRRSRRRATAYWRPSTAPRVPCDARRRSASGPPLGIEVRAGLHTGEIELRGDDIGGIAVHIGQRVSALAGPGEVLVSSTVKDLVAGSGITFAERGSHVLKGVPDEWRVFAAN